MSRSNKFWLFALVCAAMSALLASGCVVKDDDEGCNPACRSGYVCEDNECVLDDATTPECEIDDDCTGDKICNEQGVCVDDTTTPECEIDDDCTGDKVCNEQGVCVDGNTVVTCDTANPCEEGECIDGRCVVVVIHEESEITAATQWAAGTHYVKNNIAISNGILEVAPCTTILMGAGRRLKVTDNGALKMIGTEACPIKVTSDKGTPERGDWGYIQFTETSDNANNILNYVTVEFGGYDQESMIYLNSTASVEISNSIIRNSADHGIEMDDDAVLRNFVGNTVTGNAFEPISLYADAVRHIKEGTYTPNDKEGFLIVGGEVRKDAVWADHGVPYMAMNSFDVRPATGSALLTMEAGVTVKIGPHGRIEVSAGGGLETQGTADKPVTFTSTKTSPQAGDWNYISFRGDSMGGANNLVNTIFEYGGTDDWGTVFVETGSTVTMVDCTIRHSGTYGIFFEYESGPVQFEGNTITDCAQEPIKIDAGQVHKIGAGVYTPNEKEGIYVVRSEVLGNVSWVDNGVPYMIHKGIDVAGDSSPAELSLKEGVTLLMGADQGIYVRSNGKLFMDGTEAAPVIITSAMTTKTPGDWNEIDLYSVGNRWTNAEISFGGGGDYGQVWIEMDASLILEDVTFSESGDDINCDITGEGGLSVSGSAVVDCREI